MPADALAAAYLAARPQAAARVLEQAEPGLAAAVLARAGAAKAAGVLDRMLSPAAAPCLAELETEFGAEVLRAMPPPSALRLLRAMAAPRRADLLAKLPRATRAHFTAALDFPEDSVGALMELPGAVLPAGVRAAEAARRLAKAGAPHAFEVYVVDDRQRLVGAFRPGALLAAADDARIDGLLTPVEVALPLRAPVAAVRAHPAWTEHPVLPVVDGHDALAGVLSHHAVAAAAAAQPAAIIAPGHDPVDNALAAAGAFWTTLADAFTRVLAANHAPKASPEDRRD